MNLIAMLVNAGVVAAVGLLLVWLGKGRFDALDQRIDRVERRMDIMQASLDGLRSDLTHVALAVGVRPRATNR
ncbi:MAG TPA: hypothetical protein VEO00_07660 [Actinomycetota bacterium]|nr:hypothetical protein [Actinomycetota bacterium]